MWSNEKKKIWPHWLSQLISFIDKLTEINLSSPSKLLRQIHWVIPYISNINPYKDTLMKLLFRFRSPNTPRKNQFRFHQNNQNSRLLIGFREYFAVLNSLFKTSRDFLVLGIFKLRRRHFFILAYSARCFRLLVFFWRKNLFQREKNLKIKIAKKSPKMLFYDVGIF